MKIRNWQIAVGVMYFFNVLAAQACSWRDNGDGTMTDPATQLQIRVCSEGEQWTGGRNCSGEFAHLTYDEAMQRFGAGPWRLMTEKEARMLAPEGGRAVCELRPTLTSTRIASDPNYAVILGLSSNAGGTSYYDYSSVRTKGTPFRVQLVRSIK